MAAVLTAILSGLTVGTVGLGVALYRLAQRVARLEAERALYRRGAPR